MPRTEQRSLFDPAGWLAAQGALAPELAAAAFAVGRLDELAAAMGQGMATRLALIEVEAMLWAAGTPVPQEDIGRERMAARAGADLDAMALARWAVRRLEGQGGLADLRGFLGLHRAEAPGLDDALTLRPAGEGFDAAASEFGAAMAQAGALHPIARGAYARLVWRLAGLSPVEDVVEGAVWAGRAMAERCGALSFLPMGAAGRRVWTRGGPPEVRLAAHLRAVTEGAEAARLWLIRLRDWALRAKSATARIKGDSAARIIEALLRHPLALTATIETEAGISRDTAERLLARMQIMGLVREVTGTRRFRIWGAELSAR
ncbi:MAG: helix-turn-helix domain-containing protein [Paracoccus sp. (in: a-proteobacteria)]|nr:helix-turn-helix domain-containing protein [Paracoccus sp. (in: a-proteobacteria)]